jgi:hypothetical protein
MEPLAAYASSTTTTTTSAAAAAATTTTISQCTVVHAILKQIFHILRCLTHAQCNAL